MRRAQNRKGPRARSALGPRLALGWRAYRQAHGPRQQGAAANRRGPQGSAKAARLANQTAAARNGVPVENAFQTASGAAAWRRRGTRGNGTCRPRKTSKPPSSRTRQELRRHALRACADDALASRPARRAGGCGAACAAPDAARAPRARNRLRLGRQPAAAGRAYARRLFPRRRPVAGADRRRRGAAAALRPAERRAARRLLRGAGAKPTARSTSSSATASIPGFPSRCASR